MTRWKVDVHIHTAASFDGAVHPADMIAQAKQKGLDRICITDHNQLGGALLAHQLDPEFVIVGEEIKTTEGELLAFFVKEYVPPRLSPQETIARLKAQGAVISVSHPFDPYREHWSETTLKMLLPDLDALEGFNARSLDPTINQKAQQFAADYNLPLTAGSDAHTIMEVGLAYLEMPPFNSAETFRMSLREAKLRGKLSPRWVHVFSTLNKVRTKLKLKPQLLHH